MCVTSMVGDFYKDKWFPGTIPAMPSFPAIPSVPSWPGPVPGPVSPYGIVLNPVTREEFEALRNDVLEMKELLRRAKEYDERNGEPDCEMNSKVDLLRRVADMVGITLDDVFPRG